MQYYAHVRTSEPDGEPVYQTVTAHLMGTAALCRAFAADFGAANEGEMAGLAHDIGKYTPGFQHRLLDNGPIVDHATAGAIACARQNHGLIAACVAGHHSGLQNVGNVHTDQPGDNTLYGRLRKGIVENYLEQCDPSSICLPQIPPRTMQDKLQASFWIRMLYSCLVDADFLDTEQFMQGDRGRGVYDSMETLFDRLQTYIRPWQNPTTTLNRLRCDILSACMEAGSKPKGIYTLTVPTGGGKTVASLAFALRHALTHQMRRIVYVIPYTSIIEQNASVFRDILGRQNVLEHHSGVQFDLSDGAPPEQIAKALASENWDMPVIVTTAVQLFESMYANRSSRCRKLHNLANSVIIFDEAQMLPLPHLRPCIAAIAALAGQFDATVVLCTATQPALDDLMRAYAPNCSISELCPQTRSLYARFRRVSFQQAGQLTDDALAGQLSAQQQALCIVNSRKAAQRLFELLPQKGSFHLSTLMVPAHRQSVLREIRNRLQCGVPCRVVSTSLIEAGVDVDFPMVYREMAGLDSILQAAGRCNREGKRPASESTVMIFERTEPPPLLFRTAIGAAREALSGGQEPNAPETMGRYFQCLRSLSGDHLDKLGVIDAFEHGLCGCDYPFQTVAESFHLIDRNTRTVYIPYGEGIDLIQQLQSGQCSKALYRSLGRYAVSIYEPHFQALYAAGALMTAKEVPTLDQDSAILIDSKLYDNALGLSLEPESGKAQFI